MRIIIIAAMLAGCSTAPLDPLTDGTEHAVVVDRIVVTDLANLSRPLTSELAAAERHCARYGRHAQFAGKLTDWKNSYNCIRP